MSSECLLLVANMDLRKWLTKVQSPVLAGLPDPNLASSHEEARCIESANEAVEKLLLNDSSRGQKRKRGDYNFFDDTTRAKVARYAIDIGPSKAARKMSAELKRTVSESTVRSIRNAYLKRKRRGDDDVGDSLGKSLPHEKRGRPVLLGEEMDTKVKDWVRKVRENGGVINSWIVMAAADGIMTKHNRCALQKFGGHVVISMDWAKSLLKRLGFVKRKGTKGIKHLSDDFETIKDTYIGRVSREIAEHNIPDDMVVNWDQTGLCMVPGGDWTMEERGAQQVSVTGMDDKRQITLLLCVSKSGHLLPPQVIYAGKTDRCHPAVEFPEDWNVTHTPNHWSNEESMLEFVREIIVPYVDSRRALSGTSDQRALAIFDVFAAHRGKALMEALGEHNIGVVFVPAACTDKLQPLDLSLNKEYKDEVRARFHAWYSGQVMDMLAQRAARTREQTTTSGQ